MKHKLKLSFWASNYRSSQSSRKKTQRLRSNGTRSILLSMTACLVVTTILPLMPSNPVLANADTMINSVIVKKLAAYNTLLFCSTGFRNEISNQRGQYISTFDWADSERGRTENIGAGYREGSEDNDFIAIINGQTSVTNFARYSGSYTLNAAEVGLCNKDNLKTVFNVLAPDTSPQNILCKLGYTQSGMQSIKDANCKPANGNYDPTKDSFTISGTAKTSPFKPSPLLTAAASHYIRQIFYVTGTDRGGCDASDASDGTYGSGYELVTIYDYNGTAVAPYQWKKKVGCGIDNVLTNRDSTGVKDFISAVGVQLAAEGRVECEALFPPSTASGTVGEYENQMRNDKIAACVAGTINKTAGYCELTYLGVSENTDEDIKTEYEKKDKQYAKDLQDACLQGQGVTLAGDNSDDTSAAEFDICTVLDGQGNTPMRWLACSVLQAVSGVADFLFDMIESMLYTPVSEIFADPTYQDTISKFRLLSMALIFIAGLIMVIAQATGSDIVDAYTIRKVLPKLGVAIVGIAIAVPIMKFAVTLVNDIGLGMGNLVTTLTPRAMAGEVVQGNAAIGGVLGVLSLIAVGLGGALVMGPAIVTYAVVAMVALLVAFLTLAMRQLVIVTLVLLAPLAIATSVLPGTDKFWKFWRTTFITTLMMFPIIVLFLKSGIFMADIFGKMGNSSQNGLYGLIAAIIFIVPYFMLPIAFKMAGGLVGNIFGMVNDRSKGLFDRMRNWRANGRKQKTADLMAGNRFKGNTRVGNFINRRGENINAVRTGQVGLNPAKWGSQLQSASSRQALTEAEEALQKNPHMLRLKANDDFLQAGLHFNDAQAQRQYLLNAGYSERQANEAVASIRAAKRSMSNEAFENAAIIALPATGTYGKTEIDAQGNLTGGKATLVKDILKASRGDMNRADTLLALARQSAGSARRWDQAGGSYGDDRARMHALATPGSGMSEQTVTEQSLRDYIKSNGPGAVAQVRGNTVKPVAKIMMDDLQKSAILNGVGSEQFSRDLASLAGLYDTMGSMSPENATAFAEELMSSQIAGRTDNIQQMIEAHRDNDDFLTMRREYSSRYNQQAVAAAAVGQQQQQPQQPPGPGP